MKDLLNSTEVCHRPHILYSASHTHIHANILKVTYTMTLFRSPCKFLNNMQHVSTSEYILIKSSIYISVTLILHLAMSKCNSTILKFNRTQYNYFLNYFAMSAVGAVQWCWRVWHTCGIDANVALDLTPGRNIWVGTFITRYWPLTALNLTQTSHSLWIQSPLFPLSIVSCGR